MGVVNEASGEGLDLVHGIASLVPGYASGENAAIYGENEGISYSINHYGGKFVARNRGDYVMAVRGEAYPNNESEDPNTESIGVRGSAFAVQNVACERTAGVAGFSYGGGTIANIGVYGEAPAFTGGSPGNFAGYFNGTVYTTASYLPSDESLKTQIQTIDSPSEIINSLLPKQYEYVSNSRLKFPTGLHYGFLVQDVEVVLPELVGEAPTPALYDNEGEILEEAITNKAMRYNDIIAILVAGFQEQMEVIEEQQLLLEQQDSQLTSQADAIAKMETQMASVLTVVQAMQAKTNNCCNDGSSGSLTAPNNVTDGVKLLQNTPNPFDTHTRIDFTLPADAYVVLELSDAQGRPLRRLVDGQMNAGSQSIMLDGSSLAPGTYFYTVYANGEMITKKMVKK